MGTGNLYGLEKLTQKVWEVVYHDLTLILGNQRGEKDFRKGDAFYVDGQRICTYCIKMFWEKEADRTFLAEMAYQ
jgi:hypothetical protein